MEIQIKEASPGVWAFVLVSSAVVVAGRTTYSTAEEARQAAIIQHPDKKIVIIQ